MLDGRYADKATVSNLVCSFDDDMQFSSEIRNDEMERVLGL